jgi:ABC-2 type transport system permease protein
MKNLTPLMQREWFQHRFGWALMILVPLALALLLASFGHVQTEFDDEPTKLPAVLALASPSIGMALMLAVFGLTGLIISVGLARRDHADRSVEFWLSLPTGHAPSLGVPLLVHLILAPLVALVAGLLGGLVLSFVVVGRVAGIGEWFAVPWPAMLAVVLALAARLALGLVLAVVWLSPLVLLVMLMTALFRRWGFVILAVGLGLGSWLFDRLLGRPILADLLGQVLTNAGRSLLNAAGRPMADEPGESMETVLSMAPRWLLGDAADAIQLLASPLLLGGLVLAAICFAALVEWRRRGADAGS